MGYFCKLFTTAALVLFAFASAQQKQRVAVLPSVGDAEALDSKGMDLLTDKVREIASKTLPQSTFILLRQDAVIKAIGEEDLFKACKEGTCIGELAKKANADYGARCDVFKMDDILALKFELYSVEEEAILETFTDYGVKDFMGMLAVLDERVPGAFGKIKIETGIVEAKEKKRGSLWVAVGLDFLGAAAVGFGVWQNSEIGSLYKDYMALTEDNADYKGAREKTESAVSKRNISYVIGGALLAAGIGVHIWF
jgi:hypothetical protein